MQTLVLHFPTARSPMFLVFKEERHILAYILEMKICERRVSGENHFPNDLISAITLIFVYTEIIAYQNTGFVKAPLLRIIDSGRRVENCVVVNGLQDPQKQTHYRIKSQAAKLIGFLKSCLTVYL